MTEQDSINTTPSQEVLTSQDHATRAAMLGSHKKKLEKALSTNMSPILRQRLLESHDQVTQAFNQHSMMHHQSAAQEIGEKMGQTEAQMQETQDPAGKLALQDAHNTMRVERDQHLMDLAQMQQEQALTDKAKQLKACLQKPRVSVGTGTQQVVRNYGLLTKFAQKAQPRTMRNYQRLKNIAQAK